MTDPTLPTLEERRAAAIARYEWRYLERGTTTHAVGPAGNPPRTFALCGVGPAWSAAYGWFGTGTQTEYDRVEALPKCKRCLGIVGLNANLPVRTHQLRPQQGSTF